MGLAEFKGHVEEEEKEAEGEEEPEHNLVDAVDGEHDPEIVHHNKRVVNVISGLGTVLSCCSGPVIVAHGLPRGRSVQQHRKSLPVHPQSSHQGLRMTEARQTDSAARRLGRGTALR